MTTPAVSEAVRETMCPSDRVARSWESVLGQDDAKRALVNHALLALQLRGQFDFEITAVHGLIALVGPPGTGKTTLARGLAQKLAEVVPGRRARLLEVSPHGLMSSEHGQSQQLVGELLTEHLPGLAHDGLPTIVLIDEVESLAVARSETSLAANPVDVHRATDAVLTAIDRLASEAPNLVFVVTSNFVRGLDDAFLSRADVVVEFDLPNADALHAILVDVLTAMGAKYPALAALAEDPKLRHVAARAQGIDGRQARKLVGQALARRSATAVDAGQLTIGDLGVAADELAERLAKEDAPRVRAA
ncbi:MAG: family ATPase [Conexibacter sp.]|nr:family ATPase [Conexibacter sp.]